MNLQIELYGHCSNSHPFCLIELNQTILLKNFLNKGKNSFVFDIDEQEFNILKIHHMFKTNDDTIVDSDNNITADKAIELKSILLEDIKILDTVLYNKPYYVQWPNNIVENYINENKEIPEYIKNTLYFGYNGYYQFDFSGNFLKQYYKQFWENEDQAHNNQTKLISVDGKQVEAFERFGQDTAVNQDFDLTIHDLARMIENE